MCNENHYFKFQPIAIFFPSGNEIWLGGIVDRNLLFLSTKGVCIWMDRIGNPQDLVF
jgi:hypothetical protein